MSRHIVPNPVSLLVFACRPLLECCNMGVISFNSAEPALPEYSTVLVPQKLLHFVIRLSLWIVALARDRLRLTSKRNCEYLLVGSNMPKGLKIPCQESTGAMVSPNPRVSGLMKIRCSRAYQDMVFQNPQWWQQKIKFDGLPVDTSSLVIITPPHFLLFFSFFSLSPHSQLLRYSTW